MESFAKKVLKPGARITARILQFQESIISCYLPNDFFSLGKLVKGILWKNSLCSLVTGTVQHLGGVPHSLATALLPLPSDIILPSAGSVKQLI